MIVPPVRFGESILEGTYIPRVSATGEGLTDQEVTELPKGRIGFNTKAPASRCFYFGRFESGRRINKADFTVFTLYLGQPVDPQFL